MVDFRNKLLNGHQLIGTMINIFDHIDIVKIFKSCGFDYFIIDNEHGDVDSRSIAGMIALAREMDIASFVRIPNESREHIMHYMEMGANGLMLPNTDTAEQARELVKYAKYQPLGERGISMMRGHNRYLQVDDPIEYMEEANNGTILIVQIESTLSVENIDEIISVDGIDVAFIGPNDLCNSLGILGDQTNELYINAVDKVIESVQKHGKHSGIQGMNPEALESWMNKGMTFNLYSNEVNMIMNNAKNAIQTIKTYS